MDLEQTDHAAIEAALVTDKGTMVVTFFPEQAPKHVAITDQLPKNASGKILKRELRITYAGVFGDTAS